MYTVQFSQIAEKDLDAVIVYMVNTLKATEAARKLLDDTQKKLEMLQDVPFLCPVVRDESLAKKGIRVFLIGNYQIFYMVDEVKKHITILRFLYSRRNWQYLITSDEQE
jgi:toxin ParE1/3/4